MNEVTYVEASKKFAEKIMNYSTDSRDRIEWAFRSATSRAPEKDELEILVNGYERRLAMFNADPDSANSQFFICFKSAPHLDRQYSAFGKVVKGMEFIDMIKKGDPNSGSVPNPDKILSLRSK